MRTVRLPAVLACTLTLQVWMMGPTIATASDTKCPDLCSCWTEAGITKMACRTEKKDTPDTANRAGTRTQSPATATATSPTEDADDRWLTEDERRAKLEARQRELDQQLLEVQRSRFEARARHESAEEIERLEDSFADIQSERRSNLVRLKALGAIN